MRRSALLALALMSCQSPQKEVAPSPKDAAFVQAFMSTCVRDFDNRERIEAAAKTMAWRPITDPNIRKMVGPEDSSAKWNGWGFKHEGAKLMLALSDSKIDRKPFKTCVLISELDNVRGTKEKLAQLLSAKQKDSEQENGQTTEVWQFRNGQNIRLLTFIDAEPMGMKMLNAGVSNDWTNGK